MVHSEQNECLGTVLLRQNTCHFPDRHLCVAFRFWERFDLEHYIFEHVMRT